MSRKEQSTALLTFSGDPNRYWKSAKAVLQTVTGDRRKVAERAAVTLNLVRLPRGLAKAGTTSQDPQVPEPTAHFTWQLRGMRRRRSET